MLDTTRSILVAARDGHLPSEADALALSAETDVAPLVETAGLLRDRAHPAIVSYSRKVFIPLTHLCRDVCHYCTFAQPPKRGERAYMTPDEVLAVARAGAELGCQEALFTLGDKPELRYKVCRDELAALGHETTISYLTEIAGLVLKETGMLPHANPGVMTREELAALREVSVSQGIMLESISPRLMQKGMAHHGSPDKDPAARLQTMRWAGELQVPFTSGILIGIGETREERIESLLALRALHAEFGHIQEIIVQNFRAKPGTKMHDAPEPDLDDLLWTIAAARIIFGPGMNIQAPPNLSPGTFEQLVAAGLNDWGGVSPLTPDFVNPEAPWPHLEELRQRTAEAGKVLVERLAVYPSYNLDVERWQAPALQSPVLRAIDTDGYARLDAWSPGDSHEAVPVRDFDHATGRPQGLGGGVSDEVRRIVEQAMAGEGIGEDEITRLFAARGDEFQYICEQADALRKQVNGDDVTYVVNRNINYTNICYFRCQFCAFSKGKMSESLRGTPYDLGHDEIIRRTQEAWGRGATEVCMQGGIHPEYTGQTYIDILKATREAVPGIHVHAFSPLEVWQGAETLGVSLEEFLVRLKEAGLGTLPGTAAEILDDEVRATLCPDKLKTDEWLEVMETAHRVGFQTTSTIMYGHMESTRSWAKHLLRLRGLQARTGGFTEFVPLPFVHMEAPIYLKGKARGGPTFREAILLHAVARLALHPLITNIQVSWVKMGIDGVKAALNAGVNDLGGTLMNESISRAAGAAHGQEFPPEMMDEIIRSVGRVPKHRTTDYGVPSSERVQASYGADELLPLVIPTAKKYERRKAGAASS